MLYVGDLSKQDVQVLGGLSRNAARILEFGSGASTQVIAQSAPKTAEIISVETEQVWIERTEAVLAALGHPGRVQFMMWDEWYASLTTPSAGYDIILNDGIDHLRLPFAIASWPDLKIGGALIFHDTRRPHDVGNVFGFCSQNYLSVDEILLNVRASNMTVVTKKIEEPYQDWNRAEERLPWMMGWTPVEEVVANIRELRARTERKVGQRPQ